MEVNFSEEELEFEVLETASKPIKVIYYHFSKTFPMSKAQRTCQLFEGISHG